MAAFGRVQREAMWLTMAKRALQYSSWLPSAVALHAEILQPYGLLNDG